MKTFLLILLAISAVIEGTLTLAGFIAPEWMITQFRLTPTADLFFLAHVLCWFLGIVAIACIWAFRLVRRGNPAGRTVSLALGAWWVGIGLALTIKFGRPDHLVLDSAKGALLFFAAWRTR